MADPQARLLIADDTAATRYALSRLLRRDGYEVLEAADGREALEVAARERPELIILDVNLPDMLGYEVAKRLRERPETAHMIIIQLSASFTTADDQAAGLGGGADAYLLHPVAPQVLSATVATQLRARGAEQRLAASFESEQAARREAEAARAEAEQLEQRYRFLADAVPQLVWTADPNGIVEYVNWRWRELTGLDLERSRAVGWLHSVAEEDQAQVAAAWAEALVSGEPLEVECRKVCHRGGEARWFLVRAQPFRAPNGRVAQWFATATDIHEQRLASEARAKLARELEEALRARDDFLSIASHDLRGPLGTIKLRLALLQRLQEEGGARLTPEVLAKSIETGLGQVQVLEELLESLLDVSRVTSGTVDLQRERVDVSDVVHRVVERLREQASQVGSELHVFAPDPVFGQWDDLRLQQVIANLVSNAIKYGGGRPIEVCVEARTEFARIIVADRGEGIAAEDQARIFERFERLATREDKSSFGLGLWIVQRIVEAFDGRIYVSSSPGLGSRFTVDLPREVHSVSSSNTNRPSPA